MVAMPYIFGMLVFALSDSVQAAAITAIVAGVFSIINTMLNAYTARKITHVDKRSRRVLNIIGERENDKLSDEPITPVGRNRNNKFRRRRNRK